MEVGAGGGGGGGDGVTGRGGRSIGCLMIRCAAAAESDWARNSGRTIVMRVAIRRCCGVDGVEAGGGEAGAAVAISAAGAAARDRITQRCVLMIGGAGELDVVVVTGAGSVCVESNVDQ